VAYPLFMRRIYSQLKNRLENRSEIRPRNDYSGEVMVMDYFAVVSRRFACRAYKPDMVEDEQLARVLNCAQLAPTAANRQAIRIVVVKTEGRQDTLKRIYGRDWFVKAPYLLGICSIPNKCWVRGDGKNYSDVDAAIVMDHMVLAAAAQGLGTCWVAAFDPVAAREVLQLDPAWEMVAFTPLGYPDASPGPKMRKSLDELVVYR
jgi:nitroreductase